MPSSDSHSIRTNVLRRRMRWSTSFGVFWPWCSTVNMYDGRRMVQTSDKSTIAIPSVATFHTSERKRNTPAAYKAR